MTGAIRKSSITQTNHASILVATFVAAVSVVFVAGAEFDISRSTIDGCECYDVNRNGTVDMRDLAELQAAFTGS